MGAFAEARYFGWTRLDAEQRFPVNGLRSMPGRFSAMCRPKIETATLSRDRVSFI
jgi:hypothetical protein